jgi:hypothetical protein
MLALLVCTFAAALVEPGYQAAGGHDGVAVYVGDDRRVVELAAVGVVAAPPTEVLEALLAYDHHPRIAPRLQESTVLSSEEDELVVYQRLRLPVALDRDYTLRVRVTRGPVTSLYFRIAPAEGPPPRKHVVRMAMLEGRWDLQPIGDGRSTRAIYHVRMDFGGSLPRGLVRSGAARELPDLFLGYARLVSEARAGERR